MFGDETTLLEPCAPSDEIGSVLVEEDPDGEFGSEKLLLAVTGDTRLFRERAKGKFSRAAFGELRKGRFVAVWARGPVAESYPGQAEAGVVAILRSDSG